MGHPKHTHVHFVLCWWTAGTPGLQTTGQWMEPRLLGGMAGLRTRAGKTLDEPGASWREWGKEEGRVEERGGGGREEGRAGHNKLKETRRGTCEKGAGTTLREPPQLSWDPGSSKELLKCMPTKA